MAKQLTIKALFEKLNQNNILVPVEPCSDIWIGAVGYMIFIQTNDVVRYARQLNDEYTVIYYNTDCHASESINSVDSVDSNSITFKADDIVEYYVFKDMGEL